MLIRLACLTLILPTIACANSWPLFRGPDQNGHTSAKLPLTWSETENVVWKTELPGIGWSSPVHDGEHIYVTTAVPEEEVKASTDKATRSLRLICVNAKTGEVEWNNEIFNQPPGELVEIHQKNSHASPTPIIAGDKIFVHFGANGTARVSKDGNVDWKTHVPPYKAQHGTGGSPCLVGAATDGVLVISCDGRDVQSVVGLDANSGDLLWQTERNADPDRGFSFGTPLLIEAGGREMVICPGSFVVMALDPKTGKEFWRSRYGTGYSVSPMVNYHKPSQTVIVCSSFGDQSIYGIDPTGSGDVTETHVKWQVKKNAPMTPSPTLVGDLLFVISDKGVASCVEVETGEVIWTERLGGKFSASPIYTSADGGRLYWRDEAGHTTVSNAGRAFEKIAESDFASGLRTYASDAVIGDDLILRSEAALYRVGE